MANKYKVPKRGEPMPKVGEFRFATIYGHRDVFRFVNGSDGDLWAYGTCGRWYWLGQLDEISEPLVDPNRGS